MQAMTLNPFKTSSIWVRIFLVAGILAIYQAASGWWHGPMRLLHSGASDIRNHYEDGGFTGDFARQIRATCSPEFFHEYARQQRLLPVENGTLPEGCPGWGYGAGRWWSPPRDYTGAYYTFEKGGYRRLLAYRGGFLYYDICAW